ncbi:MAG: hypothetical protein JXA30_07955 [Deltaproteobacteria bacterium]|nr:hypothetical protein [Deltaproteobacteria bacterium]
MTYRLSLISLAILLLLLSSEVGCSLVSDFEGYDFEKVVDDRDAQVDGGDAGSAGDGDGGKVDAGDGGKIDAGDGGAVKRCKASVECATGFCVDGFCCNTRCAGGCESCAIPGKLGRCTPVPKGEDPNGACPPGVGDNAPCIPGGCNGENDCLVAPPTQVCRAASCSDGVAVDQAFCEDNGVCPALSETECFPYACGDDVCNSSCDDQEECHPDYYCDQDSNVCIERRQAGDNCDAQEQCAQELTCLDGVCCVQDRCPTCRNCGEDGECSVVIEGDKDDSGRTCNEELVCDDAGDCKRELGVGCSDSSQCASDICLDGVCCSVPECGVCIDCGQSGQCEQKVTGRDDISGLSCSGTNTCNSDAECIRRWEIVGKTGVSSPYYPEYVTAADINIMFANESNPPTGTTHYVNLFNTETKNFVPVPTTNDEFYCCEYMGTLVSYDTAFFFMSKDAVYYKPGYTAWTTIAGYLTAPNVQIGEAATAVIGDRIYRIGGRGKLTLTQYYDIGDDAFITTGLADHPVGIESACAGAYNGKLYVLYYQDDNTPKMTEYTEERDTWVTLPNDANAPLGCIYRNFPVWRGFLLHSWNGFRRFNLESRVWEPEPIPIPDPELSEWTPAVTSDGILYALGYDASEKLVLVYRWILD